MASMEQIKELRALTGAGLSDVKEALDASNNDFEEAKKYLAKKGVAKAEKRSEREANQGIIASYIHNTNKVAVIAEVNCETDFVAKSEDFMQFGKEVAMQIAAMNPLYVSREDIPANVLDEMKEAVLNDASFASKPQEVKDRILESKMNTFAQESCLLEQKSFKDDSVTIDAMLKAISSKVGEAVKIKRFTRYEVGN
jgi:elongation factor Ts